MNPFVSINKLSDVDIAGDGDEGVGVFAGEAGMVRHLFGEEGDHVSDGDFGCLGKVFVEAHGDVVSGCFGAGPEEG